MTKDNSKVLALFVADLHLSLTPPPYRSTEPDWFAAMARPLDELTQLQEKYSCPIFCAGDIFDRWNAPAELINWAMTHLPYVHCIPGQHDLPEHDLGQIERSAYWTLVKASVIRHLGSESIATCFNMDGIVVHSYPYGVKISSRHKLKSKWIQIALIHQYNWVPNAVYKQDAPKDQHVDSSRKEFEGYDLIVAGDNHIPFDVMMGETRFVNCGGFMIRKSDDCWQPRIWKLIADGRMEPHPLGTSKDKYLDTEDVKRMEEQPEDFDLSELFDSLGKLGTDLIDVRQAFLRAFRGEPNRRTKMLLKAMEG
jgi:hypothetical protein